MDNKRFCEHEMFSVSCEVCALTARVAELEEVLADAGRVLDWAARKMKGNCDGHDINTVMMAAGRTAEARAALRQPAPPSHSPRPSGLTQSTTKAGSPSGRREGSDGQRRYKSVGNMHNIGELRMDSNQTMTDITIPPAALDAAMTAYLEAADTAVGAISYEDCMRAACLAMLKNWPGMDFARYFEGRDGYGIMPASHADTIILPLTETPEEV